MYLKIEKMNKKKNIGECSQDSLNGLKNQPKDKKKFYLLQKQKMTASDENVL